MLSSQLSAAQGQYQQSQAAQQESDAQLVAVRAKLKAAEDSAAAQQVVSQQLQQKLSTAESGLLTASARVQQLQAAHQALSEELKRQREACGEEETAHKNADAQVGLSSKHKARANCLRPGLSWQPLLGPVQVSCRGLFPGHLFPLLSIMSPAVCPVQCGQGHIITVQHQARASLVRL